MAAFQIMARTSTGLNMKDGMRYGKGLERNEEGGEGRVYGFNYRKGEEAKMYERSRRRIVMVARMELP
jgi:hypothetical protein